MVEHPIYDVWLVDCKGGTDVIATVENDGGETKVTEEEAARELDATEVGFASMSEEEFAELQKDDE